MGGHCSKTPQPRLVVPHHTKSKLQNLFILGTVGALTAEFIHQFCEEITQTIPMVLNGILRNSNTRVWAYTGTGTGTDEAQTWESVLERCDFKGETHSVALCFLYGERFSTDSTYRYIDRMYESLHFTSLELILTGPTVNMFDTNSPSQFYNELGCYAAKVAATVCYWYPQVKCRYWISGVGLWRKMNKEQQLVLNDEANRLLQFIRDWTP